MEFKIKKVTTFEELFDKSSNTDLVIPTSDLTFANEQGIVQFERVEEEESKKKLIIKPGTFRIGHENNRLALLTTELRKQHLLESAINTQRIKAEADRFYSKLHIYDMLEEPKARKLLLYSDPGCGKTSSIAMYSLAMREQDPGSVVILWPTSQIDSDDVLDLLSDAEYNPDVTKMLLVMEDIGGGEREGHGGARGVDSAMLDLLDGVRNVYKVATFVIATTNYPQNLLSALADRPGRFDLLLKLDYPIASERIALTEFFAKRALTEDEKEAVGSKKTKEFSVAHLKEAVVRHYLGDISIEQAIDELLEHKKKYEKNFEEKQESGFGLR